MCFLFLCAFCCPASCHAENSSSDQRQACKKHELYVSFRDLGWQVRRVAGSAPDVGGPWCGLPQGRGVASHVCSELCFSSTPFKTLVSGVLTRAENLGSAYRNSRAEMGLRLKLEPETPTLWMLNPILHVHSAAGCFSQTWPSPCATVQLLESPGPTVCLSVPPSPSVIENPREGTDWPSSGQVLVPGPISCFRGGIIATETQLPPLEPFGGRGVKVRE